MCSPKGWAGCLNGVALLSKIPVPLFGTPYPQYRSFSFRVEVLHGKAISSCVRQGLVLERIYLGR
jgi:hypothetical protein